MEGDIGTSKNICILYLACNVTNINDGICQDETNIPECGFDGGDCCIPHSVMQFKECQVCECHESTGIPFKPCKYMHMSAQCWE